MAQPRLHNFEAYQTPPPSHYGDLPPTGPVPSQHRLDPIGHHTSHLSDNFPSKPLNAFSEEAALNPLCINYASVTGLDMSSSQYPQYNPQLQVRCISFIEFSSPYLDVSSKKKGREKKKERERDSNMFTSNKLTDNNSHRHLPTPTQTATPRRLHQLGPSVIDTRWLEDVYDWLLIMGHSSGEELLWIFFFYWWVTLFSGGVQAKVEMKAYTGVNSQSHYYYDLGRQCDVFFFFEMV